MVRNHVAALPAADPPYQPADPTTGTVECYCAYPNDWNPNAKSTLGAHVIATAPTWIVVGGDFPKVNGGAVTQAKFAEFAVSSSP